MAGINQMLARLKSLDVREESRQALETEKPLIKELESGTENPRY